MMALSGATSDGLSTIVQPAASAGATLQAIWLIGQFHGVISAQTPIGSRTSSVVPISFSNSNSASTRRAVMKWPMPAPAWARCANAQRRAHLLADDLTDVLHPRRVRPR